MSVPQGRHGYCQFTNAGVSLAPTMIPVFHWAMPGPDNLVTPMPVGNSFLTHHGEGLKTTQFVTNFDVRIGTSEIMQLPFWNMFFKRDFSGGFDDTNVTTIAASDGAALWTLSDAKWESFTLSIANGAQVGLQAVWVAPGVPVKSAHVPSAYAPVNSKAPLMFDAVSFTGITGNVYSAEITASNGHVPNGNLNSTKYLTAWDAGVMTCGANFTFDARTYAGSAPFSAGATLTMALAGDATVTFTLKKVTMNNPRDPNANVGQSFNTRNCIVEGDSSPARPLAVVVA